MKKLMTMILLACGTVAMAQGSKTILPRSLSAVPQAFALDGKAIPYMYFYGDESEPAYCTILDENLQEVKTINLVEATCNWHKDIEERTETGEWTTRKEEGVDNEGIISIYLNDWRSSYADGESFCLSQTLFNDDAAFEYVLPLMEIQKGETEEIDRDNDGEIDYKETSYSPQTVGYSIVSETGTVLQSIRFDEGFTSWSELNADIYLMGDKCYLVFEGYVKAEDGSRDVSLVYSLDRTSNAIQKVAMHMGPKVSPTVADRSETITVELGETNAREIQVVNAAGKTMLRLPVRNGQKQVSFSARNLSRGVNVVNVVGDKNSNQTKIIVK